MIIQGTNVTADIEERADVVVVGSGAGGATLAVYLAERGWDVVVVERGGFFTARDFSQVEEEALGAFNGRRGLDTTVDNAFFLNYAEAVGGTTVHYWGDSFRAPRDRLELWRERAGVEWAHPDELDPHYDAIEAELGIHPAEEALFNDNNRLVRAGCEALGWEGDAVPTARVDCIACGWTQFGCAYNRKSSMLITTIPRISKVGGRIYSDARVERILLEDGRAAGIEAVLVEQSTKAPRARLRVRAEFVVLAGGALGTAELLLRNVEDDTVGRRFYMNPHFWVYGDFGREIQNVTGIPCAYAVHEFRRVRLRDGSLAPDAGAGREEEYAGGGYIMLCSHQSPGITAASLSETGPEHLARMRKYRHLGALMSVIDEAYPGRVFLDRGVRKTEFRLQGIDRLKAVDYIRHAARIFLAAGAVEVWVPDVYGTVIRSEAELERVTPRSVEANAQFAAGSHLLGTAPMGADPEDSFAGPTGEAHRIPHLYVADGAAIPTSVSVDPSLTIMAVARWIAASLHERTGRAGA